MSRARLSNTRYEPYWNQLASFRRARMKLKVKKRTLRAIMKTNRKPSTRFRAVGDGRRHHGFLKDNVHLMIASISRKFVFPTVLKSQPLLDSVQRPSLNFSVDATQVLSHDAE